MSSPFETLLKDLGQVFHLGLHTDRLHACTIQIDPHLKIQLQLDASQENLWIFSKLIELPAGKFRENILKNTLKENGQPDPRTAIFGYIAATNELAMFQKYPLNILNGESLSGIIGAFAEMGAHWIDAIANGETSPPLK